MKTPEQNAAETWGSPEVVAARRKWTEAQEATTREATEVLLAAAQLRPGMRVLDLASGTGNPALAIAAAVAPQGQAAATDIVPDLLAYAEERARARGLANFSTQQASADSLPFPDVSFDLVTCRFGVMFFPQLPAALREVRRVLKLGGRAVFVAWGPTSQPFFQLTFGLLLQHVDTSFEAEAHEPFKFGQQGTLSAALKGAGFPDVREESREITLRFPGSVEEFWTYLLESAALVRKLFEGIAPEKRDRVLAQAYTALRPHADGSNVLIPAMIVVASATR